MLDETLLITASRAARGITAAQAAVDEAKRLVEEAKLGVETAKAGLVDAKAAYDAVISEIAGSGVSASKARKAVEDMLRIFADVGIIDAPAEDAAPAEPKAPRRKKSEAAPPPAEIVEAVTKLSAQGEPGVIVIGEQASPAASEASADTAADEVAVAPATEPEAPAEENSDVVEPEAAVEEVTESPAVETLEEAAAEEAPASGGSDEIDNQEALREIYEIIESSTIGEDLTVSETLIAMLNAAEWYSREHRGEPLSLDLYREILNVDFAAEALTAEGLGEEVKGGLEAVVDAKNSDKVFEWFLYALGNLENGKPHLGYAEYFAPAPAEVESVEASPTVLEEIIEEDAVANSDDFISDPEAEEAEVDVSDDETLAVDQVLVGEEVADIEEINFLEPAAEAAPAEPVKVTEPASAPAAEADKVAPPRRFSRPSFVPKK